MTTEVKHFKKFLESNKPQFVRLPDEIEVDDDGKQYLLLVAKRLKDNEIFYALPNELWIGAMIEKDVLDMKEEGITAELWVEVWISDFMADCIHVFMNASIILVYQNKEYATIRDCGTEIEINDIEEAIDVFFEETYKVLKEKKDWVNSYRGGYIDIMEVELAPNSTSTQEK